MIQTVSCRGAPRDLGWDQGRACVEFLRRPQRRHGWGSGGQLGALVEDLRRHFPHQSEQLEGIARGAGVSLRVLARQWLRAFREPHVAIAAECEGTTRLYAALPSDAILRHSLSEGRFATAEFCRPALTAPLLGVNEAGLAVAVSGRCEVDVRGAPGALLARDCLERFEEVETAAAWCQVRPASAGYALLLADAAGGLCAVDRRAGVVERAAARSGMIDLDSPSEAAEELLSAIRRGESALYAELQRRWGGALAVADPVTRRARLVGPELSP